MTDKLEGKEKIFVWIANIINPVIAGMLFYYMWKKSFPEKAKQVNRISFIVFGLEVAVYLLYIVATQSSRI